MILLSLAGCAETLTDFSVLLHVEPSATEATSEFAPSEVMLEVGGVVYSAARLCEARNTVLALQYDDGSATACALPVGVSAWIEPRDDATVCDVGLQRLLEDTERPADVDIVRTTVFADVDDDSACPVATDFVELTLR